MRSIKDFAHAEGMELFQPLAFGKYRGKSLKEIPAEYLEYLLKNAGITMEQLRARLRAAVELRNGTIQRHAVDTTQLPGDLFNWQRQWITRFSQSEYMAAFADMGTGKTRAVIEYLRARWLSSDVAIVFCPKSVTSSWLVQLGRYAPELTAIILSGATKNKLSYLSINRRVYITNYESVLSEEFLAALLRRNPQWMILDESHRIKTPNSQTTKAMMRLSFRIPYRIAMTGTPITNSEMDIFSQVTVLDQGKHFGRSWYHFRRDNFQSDYMGHKFEIRPDRLQYIQHVMSEVGMVVAKKDVLDLPEKTYIRRPVELSAETVKYYRQMERDLIVVINNTKLEAKFKIVELLRLHQIAGGGINEHNFGRDKLDSLMDLLEDTREPVIIVAVYKREIAAIADELRKSGRTVGIIAGGVSDAARSEAIAEFSAGRLDAIVLQEDAGGLGIDGLQNHCRLMVFYSCNYRWDSRRQVEDRLHRSGQTGKCLYIDLLATIEGHPTIDWVIASALAAKNDRISEIVEMVAAQVRADIGAVK